MYAFQSETPLKLSDFECKTKKAPHVNGERPIFVLIQFQCHSHWENIELHIEFDVCHLWQASQSRCRRHLSTSVLRWICYNEEAATTHLKTNTIIESLKTSYTEKKIRTDRIIQTFKSKCGVLSLLLSSSHNIHRHISGGVE